MCSSGYFIHINNSFWNFIIAIASFLIGMLSILCIYVSIGEMILLNERKNKDKINIEKAMKNGKYYSVDYVLSLLEKNDIIDMLILSKDQIIKLGASSDCNPGSSSFFDKEYYVNDKNNVTVEELNEMINFYSTDSKVFVVAIDGVPPK
jgi:hypothetical protein